MRKIFQESENIFAVRARKKKNKHWQQNSQNMLVDERIQPLHELNNFWLKVLAKCSLMRSKKWTETETAASERKIWLIIALVSGICSMRKMRDRGKTHIAKCASTTIMFWNHLNGKSRQPKISVKRGKNYNAQQLLANEQKQRTSAQIFSAIFFRSKTVGTLFPSMNFRSKICKRKKKMVFREKCSTENVRISITFIRFSTDLRMRLEWWSQCSIYMQIWKTANRQCDPILMHFIRNWIMRIENEMKTKWNRMERRMLTLNGKIIISTEWPIVLSNYIMINLSTTIGAWKWTRKKKSSKNWIFSRENFFCVRWFSSSSAFILFILVSAEAAKIKSIECQIFERLRLTQWFAETQRQFLKSIKRNT